MLKGDRNMMFISNETFETLIVTQNHMSGLFSGSKGFRSLTQGGKTD